MRWMRPATYRGHNRRDRAALEIRLDEILRKARVGEISWGGAGELARSEVQWWREADPRNWRRLGCRSQLAGSLEFLFFPARFSVRQIEPDHLYVRIEATVGWICSIAIPAITWLIVVSYIFPNAVGLGFLAAWFSAQLAYLVFVGIRFLRNGPRICPLQRADVRTRCVQCHYDLQGLPEAFEAARELGPACCVECGYLWPKLA
jgi:hypothetical protein